MAVESVPPAAEMVGRASMMATLRLALDEAAHSGGRALLLRGDPGVGKSALLDAVAGMAADRGWRLLRTDGTPAEQRLPLAGLHKLLRPVGDQIASLARGRREALEGSFGSPETDLDVFRVALACLDLVSSMARSVPVVVLVDDAQWLDRSSAEVLAFVARRLEADAVLLLAASRYTDDQPLVAAGVPNLHVPPLDGSSSAVLLDRSSPDLGAAARQTVLGLAAGNPLALLELPLSLPDGRHPEGDGGGLLLTRRLERGFLGRTAELPPATRDVLLVAAVDDSADVAEVVRAASRLAGVPRTPDDLGPAAAEGLVRRTPSGIAFRHPLVRSAVQQGVAAERRRAAHAALAAVVVEPDRRTWHRASAVVGHDESVAAELDDAASRAQRRGSVPGALQALERAAELSGSSAARGRRLLRAAELTAQSGRASESRGYLDGSRPLLADPHDRLLWKAVDELTDESMHGGARRVDALVGLAEESRLHGDEDLALRFLLRAAMRCWHLDFGGDAEQRVVAAADRSPAHRHDPRRLVVYAYASPFERAADILDVLVERAPSADDDPADLLMYGYAGACIGAYREAEIYCRAAADGLRDQDRLTQLAEALSLLAWSALRRSRWQVAAPAAEECVRIAREIGQPVPEAAGLAASAAIAGIQGDDAAAEALARSAEELAMATRNTIGLAVTHLARGLAAAGRGRTGEAFEQFWHLYSPRDPSRQRMQACRTIGYLAEAAAHTGRQAQAKAELDKLERLVGGSSADGVQVAMRLARAFLAEPDDAERAFALALEADWRDWPFEHGRLLLAHGSWLRRRQRVTESRTQLRAALDAFLSTGARPWAEQARRELRAAGDQEASPGAPASDGWERLSPREAQIVELVGEGLSNKEIGQRLYLSPRTVGSHLYRVFPKLGVTSRGQLARTLAVTRRPQPDVPVPRSGA